MTDFKFAIPLTVRINDLNYADHVGHQHYFSFFQESRAAYLKQFGCTEMNIGGLSTIMSEANCKYKLQLFLNERVQVACRVSELRPKRFTMVYEIKKNNTACAAGLTISYCYNYQSNKIVNLPDEFVRAVQEFEGLKT